MIRKKEMLSIPPAPPDGMRDAVKRRKKNFWHADVYLTAQKNHRVLEIDGYEETKKKRLIFRHFFDGKNYKTIRNDSWTGESLEYAIGYGMKPDVSEGFEAIVEKQIGKRFRWSTGIDEIRYRETEINRKKRLAAEKRKLKRIKDHLEEITPPLPAGFTSWAKKKGDSKNRYLLLYQRQKTDGIITRYFKIEPGGAMTEVCRASSESIEGIWDEWFWGYRNGRYGKNQEFDRTKNLWVCNQVPKKVYLYEKTLEELGTRQQVGLMRAMNGAYIDWAAMFYMLEKNPEIEMVAKAGFPRLAVEMCESDFNLPGKSVREMYGLTLDQERRLKTVNGGVMAIRILKAEKTRIPEKDLRMMQDIRMDALYQLLDLADAYELNILHVWRTLRKAKPRGKVTGQLCGIYADYIHMAAHRGQNVREDIVFRNKNFVRLHDQYAEEEQREKDEIERERRARMFSNIAKDADRNRRIFGKKDSGFEIIVPESCGDIEEEGRMQHNCVGASDHYMRAMHRRESWIVFLRKTDEPGKSFYTIEVDEKRILQAYGEYNRQPEWETVKPWLDKWMKSVRKKLEKIRKEEALRAAG